MVKNKKSLALIIGSIALALVLALPLTLSATFSKYLKNAGSATETGTVAAFGVTMAWNEGGAFFATEYAKDAEGHESITNSVEDSLDALTLAPGTTGSRTLTLSGSSEVAFEFALNVTETYSAGWKVSAESAEYHPITVTVTEKVGDAEATTLSAGAYTKSFAPGDIETTVYTITWTWAFEGGNDAADTYVAGLGTETYTITPTASATQID